MLNDQQFLGILRSLLEKSKNDKVHWKRSGRRQDSFLVAFNDESMIVVSFFSPPSEPDLARAELIVRGDSVFAVQAEDGDPNYLELRELYEDAFRSVTGWDGAIEQIEKELSGDGDVGVSF